MKLKKILYSLNQTTPIKALRSYLQPNGNKKLIFERLDNLYYN